MISSTIFQTFLLIVFSISGHICLKGYEHEEKDLLPIEYYRAGHSLCNPYFRSNFEIKSVFNLDQDIYVQSKDERGVHQMWRIPIISYDPDFDATKYDVDLHYRNPSFAELLDKLFDLEKPISGFYVYLIDWPQVIRKCFQAGPIGPASTDCFWIEVMDSTPDADTPDLVCIYGTDKLTGNLTAKPILHRPVETKEVDDLLVPIHQFKDDQKDMFNKICSVKSPERVQNPNDPFIYSMVSINKWRRYSEPHMDLFIEEAVPRDKSKKYVPKTLITIQMYDRKGKNISKVFNVTKDRKDISIGFYYNDFAKFLFCGHPCYLDSPLKWTTDFKPPKFWFNETGPGINGLIPTPIEFKDIFKNPLTIRTLINCESFDFRLFQPNDICSGKMSFLSIFNLGKDVYFQRSGRFWKYSSDGFTSGSNSFADDLDVRISPVRYDSDFTEFLESEGFDTSSKIVGVNFKAKYQDLCNATDWDCIFKYRISEHHFKVCLYGVKSRINKDEVDVKFGDVFYRVYSYTPSKLFRINKQPPESFCHKFMTSVLGEYGGDPFEHFSVTNPTNETVSQYLGVGYNVVYSFNKWDAREGQVFVRHHWKKDKPDFKYDGVTHDQISHNERGRPFTYIFSMNGQVWGYSDERNGDLYRFIVDPEPDRTYMEETIGGNLYNLLNCPFISSTSVLTPIPRQKVCTKYSKRETDSTLQIGSSHYHQIGKHFYKWSDSRFFYYDKQISNLLNDHFDTSKRVMGYSFSLTNLYPDLFRSEEKQKEYAVVIYGTSHQRYRKLGKKVYGLFRLNEFLIPTLIAVNDHKVFPFDNTILFGTLIPDSKAPKILCYFAANGPNKDMKNESAFFTYLEDLNDLLVFKLTNHSSQLNYPFHSSVYNQEKWIVFTIEKKEVPFQQIVGFSHHGKLVTVLAKEFISFGDNPNDMIQYFLGLGTENTLFQPNFNISEVHLIQNNSWELLRYYDYFQQYCEKPKYIFGSESESHNGILTSVLVFILLVLLITALIVGITGYFRNEKNAKNQTAVSVPNVAKPTQSGPQSGPQSGIQSDSAAKPSKTGVNTDEKSVRSV